jgi:four helix bundle protein
MQSDGFRFKQEFQRRAYKFALDIIEFIEQLPRGSTSHIISGQLLRSATSIGANVIEAQAASSKKDYANFFTHALKSANETKFWISLLRDSGKSAGKPAEKLLKEADEIANILAASILTLKGKR